MSHQAVAVSDIPQSPSMAKPAVLARQWLEIAVGLGLLLVVFWGFNIENRGFLKLSVGGFAAALAVPFIPPRFRLWFNIAASALIGLLVLAQGNPWNLVGFDGFFRAGLFIGGLFATALVIYGIFALPVRTLVRVGLMLAFTGILVAARARTLVLPNQWWAVLGAIFMFRTIVYAYDVTTTGKRPPLKTFLAYMFLLPNFHFLLFPVVDFTTFQKTQVDGAEWYATARQGMTWMVRGTLQLLLYRLLYHRVLIPAEAVNSFGSMLHYVLPSYLLYVRISGQFHLAVGMLHLFGYRLPETNKRWLLASSFTDFWRRINIYWKDFMVKCFYYPAYFRLRRWGDARAIIGATVFVFLATTFLHGYQFFWLQNDFRVTTVDGIFWTALGVLVLAAVFRERAQRGAPARSRAATVARRVAGTAYVYITISFLWSMWSSASLTTWFETVTYWR